LKFFWKETNKSINRTEIMQENVHNAKPEKDNDIQSFELIKICRVKRTLIYIEKVTCSSTSSSILYTPYTPPWKKGKRNLY